MSKKKKHTDKAMRRALQRLPEKQPASYSLDFPALPDGVKPNGIAMDGSPLGNFGADVFSAPALSVIRAWRSWHRFPNTAA